MRVSIGFSGPAGAGIVTAGVFLGDILAKKGYYIVGDKEYESIIKGGNNLFVLYISDEGNYVSKEIDYFFSYDKYAIEKNEKIYDLKNIFEINKSDCTYQNTYSIAMAMKVIGLDSEELKDLFKNKFENKPEILEKNIVDIEKGFNFIKKSELDLSQSIGNEKLFWFGNEVIGLGAIESGLEYYAAYPMTPASSIIDVVIDPKLDKRPTFFQGEDEIAVSMSMLGAHFAGKRAMCGTSGGGFALMSESISFANQAELGGVYVLSQRAGPSTGTPTYTEQGDISYALNPSFGGTYPIVVCPDSSESAYNLIGKSLNWSDQYQHPVVFLVDKFFSESYFSLDKDDLNVEKINRGKRLDNNTKTNGISDDKYARYEIIEDGISPYTIPGVKNGEFIATSYEHDIYGATSENTLEKKIMTEKRMKKIEKTFVNEVFNKDFYGYEIINPNANKFFVTLGTNSYILKDFVKKNIERGLIIVKILHPVDPRLTKFFEDNFDNIDKLIFVEQNYTGQFEQYLKTECNLRNNGRESKIGNNRKYTNYPFFVEDFDSLI